MSSINSNTLTLTPSRLKNELKLLPTTYKIRENDVLCGRGSQCFNHLGNKHFRQIVQVNLDRYMMAQTKNCKSQIIHEIITFITSEKYGGSFIKKDLETGCFYNLSDFYAREKTSQAFRVLMDLSKKTRSFCAVDPTETNDTSLTVLNTTEPYTSHQTQQQILKFNMNSEGNTYDENLSSQIFYETHPILISSVALDQLFSISTSQLINNSNQNNQINIRRRENSLAPFNCPKKPRIWYQQIGKTSQGVEDVNVHFSHRLSDDIDSFPKTLTSHDNNMFENFFDGFEEVPYISRSNILPESFSNYLLPCESNDFDLGASHDCHLQLTCPDYDMQMSEIQHQAQNTSPIGDVQGLFTCQDDHSVMDKRFEHHRIHMQLTNPCEGKRVEEHCDYSTEQQDFLSGDSRTKKLPLENDIINDDCLLFDKLFELVFGQANRESGKISSKDSTKDICD